MIKERDIKTTFRVTVDFDSAIVGKYFEHSGRRKIVGHVDGTMFVAYIGDDVESVDVIYGLYNCTGREAVNFLNTMVAPWTDDLELLDL